MRGDEQRLVGGVDPQAVDMARARIGCGKQIADCGSIAIVATARESDDRDGDDGRAQSEQNDREPVALLTTAANRRIGVTSSRDASPTTSRGVRK
jgi:hypothetical protein